MKDYRQLKEQLCKELDEYARKGSLGAGDLQTIHMLTDTIKNIEKMELLENGEEEYSSYSQRRDARGRYSRDGGNSYDGGDSYAGGGYSGNRMSGRGRMYSRDDGKARVMEILEGMMDGVQGPERQTIQRMMDMARDM